MPTTNPVSEVGLKLGTETIVRAGPVLGRVPPLRGAAAWASKQYFRAIKNKDHAESYSPGMQEDLFQIRLVFVHALERLLAQPVAPAARRALVRNLLYGSLLEQGYRDVVDRFQAQYGTRPPGLLVISPGKACNLHCSGCYADSGTTSEKLDWTIFNSIIMQAKALWGVRFFVITGGEPLAYRSLGKGVLEAAEKHPDCYFLMYTNGTLIGKEVTERLASIGNITPAISVEGWRERTDARRGAGVFDQALAAMARLRSAGVPFGLSLTATRDNAEEILSDEFVNYFFEQQGALYGWLFHYMPIGRSPTLDLMPTPDQRMWMWRRSWELIRERHLFIGDFWNHGTLSQGCIAAGRSNGGGYLHIDWNGAVTPCVFVPYSPVNIHEVFARGGTINDAWAHPFLASIREWQAAYRQSGGNWLAPCPIRDHHADFRQLLDKHQPQPTDANARAALLDPDYAAGLAAYDAAYQALSEDVWQSVYDGGKARSIQGQAGQG